MLAAMSEHVHHAIDYVEINVSDLAAAKAFYTEAFGWQFTDYGPDYAGIRWVEGDGEVGGLNATGVPSGARRPPCVDSRRYCGPSMSSGFHPIPAFCVMPNRWPLGACRSVSSSSGKAPAGPGASL